MGAGKALGRRRKLIEVSVPLEAISAASEKEKNIRQGHPSTLHLWWARRPLAACRAVLFAQLVDDPSAWPERFRGEEAQAAERARLHGIIERMVKWEATTDEGILGEARWEIARSVAWGLGEEPPASDKPREVLAYLREKGPPVYDPFCGGGSIPLEAQRLGLRAYGSDLNPVAVLITKALVEIPPRFGGRSPVNPVDRKQMGDWRGAAGLAADLRHYGGWMRDEAERRIGHLYPKAKLPDGGEAKVIAYIWARTVASPDPSVKGAHVPLISSYMLSRKKDKKVWVEIQRGPSIPGGYRFEVKSGELTPEEEKEKHLGTKLGPKQGFRCTLTGDDFCLEHVRKQGIQQQLSKKLMAVVADGGKGRVYLTPTPEQEKVAALDKPTVSELDAEISDYRRSISTQIYGIEKWRDLFTARQMTALQTFSNLIAEAREKVLQDAHASSLSEDSRPLAESGEGAVAYADAVATYLAFTVDKMADYNSNICTWHNSGQKIGHTFARQALPMVWDFAEANPFSGSTGSFASGLAQVARVLERLGNVAVGECHQVDAPHDSYPVHPACIATDPPYYDNIGYAALSDFFHVWLRCSLREVWPSLFRRIVTPKEKELIANRNRHGGSGAAEQFFMEGMSGALKAMHGAALENAPITLFYAFKQSEIKKEGITSAGWASFLQAVINAGFIIDGTWPMRTEMPNKVIGISANMLASSIVLVCVKRPEDAREGTRQEFRSRLKAEMPAALQKIKEAGVGPVDMTQSALGPGMGIFSTYTKVLELDDSEMSVRDAIALINQIREEILGEEDAYYDDHTRFCIDWFQTFGMEEGASGAAITMAQGYNLSIDDGMLAGVFSAKKGKARLISRWDMPREWQPDAQRPPPHWECLQHLIVALEALDGGTTAAAELLAQMDSEAGEAARRLAHRLYDICEKKGWAQEARSYNILGSEFFHMETRANAILQNPPLKQTDLELQEDAG